MLLLLDLKTELNTSAPEVFAFISDLANLPDWLPGAMRVEPADASPTEQVGKTYIEQVRLPGGRVRPVRIRVVRSEPGRLLCTEGELPPLLPRMEWRVMPVSSTRCVLHWRVHSRQTHWLFRLLGRPLARYLLRRRGVRGIALLQQRFGT